VSWSSPESKGAFPASLCAAVAATEEVSTFDPSAPVIAIALLPGLPRPGRIPGGVYSPTEAVPARSCLRVLQQTGRRTDHELL
jgi:hypothetical protein